jgi:hypothetical protein
MRALYHVRPALQFVPSGDGAARHPYHFVMAFPLRLQNNFRL